MISLITFDKENTEPNDKEKEESSEEIKETKPTEKTITSIPAGIYKVGVDMQPGEYMLFSNSIYHGYVCVSSDSNQDDITFNENFSNNYIATFNEGDYVELSRCTAYPFESVTNDMIDIYNDDGVMLKVGTNIKAGEYKLENTSNNHGYWCIYSDSRESDIVSNDNFEKSAYVTVKDGQYLYLSRCKIVK